MRYVLLICGDESYSAAASAAVPTPGCGGWAEEMSQRGILRGGAGLQPSSVATTVRVREGETLVADGPFAETKDHIGGFSIIECDDLDQAIDVASRHPVAANGTIEIRPVWEQ